MRDLPIWSPLCGGQAAEKPSGAYSCTGKRPESLQQKSNAALWSWAVWKKKPMKALASNRLQSGFQRMVGIAWLAENANSKRTLECSQIFLAFWFSKPKKKSLPWKSFASSDSIMFKLGFCGHWTFSLLVPADFLGKSRTDFMCVCWSDVPLLPHCVHQATGIEIQLIGAGLPHFFGILVEWFYLLIVCSTQCVHSFGRTKFCRYFRELRFFVSNSLSISALSFFSKDHWSVEYAGVKEISQLASIRPLKYWKLLVICDKFQLLTSLALIHNFS